MMTCFFQNKTQGFGCFWLFALCVASEKRQIQVAIGEFLNSAGGEGESRFLGYSVFPFSHKSRGVEVPTAKLIPLTSPSAGSDSDGWTTEIRRCDSS